MKKLFITVSLLAIVTVAHAVTLSPIGPVNCKLTAITQGLYFDLNSKTNTSNTATNTTLVYKSTTIKTPFNSTNLLALVANSFHTNFQDGSQIAFRFSQIFVVDNTGTNIIFDPGAVIAFHFDEQMLHGTQTEMMTENKHGSSFSDNSTLTYTISATMSYNDIENTTGDGTHTQFQFKGLMTVTVSENLKTGAQKSTTSFEGTGGGPIRNVDTILTGTITVKAMSPPTS